MARKPSPASSERASGAWDALTSSFGFPTGVAIVLGLVAGFGMPALDALLIVDIPVFSFDTQDAARSLLETVATVTVAVAGIAFSVTVVAFTLASNQLSPRVLRSFRTDRLVQITLAMFVGTFIYCLAVLVRLGTVNDGTQIPNLSITLAVALAIGSFGLFAAFIAHIVTMLQPSSIIDAIRRDALSAQRDPFPQGVGREPDDPVGAQRTIAELPQRRLPVEAEDQGYLTLIGGDAIVEGASSCGAVVGQQARIGEYVVPGQPLAVVWAEEPEQLEDLIRDSFILGRQRTFVQDSGFGIRQLADVALKGLSPGINDPTTAQNAMEAMTGVLVRMIRSERPSAVRVDREGVPRFIALPLTLDELVRLGFDQVRTAAAPHPTISIRLLVLLEGLRLEAQRWGRESDEIERQAALIREAAGDEAPTGSDAARVRASTAVS